MAKRYYWLKLPENFFDAKDDGTIEFIEEMEGGREYVLFYLKLLCKALRTEGTLIKYIGTTCIPYDEASLAKLTNTPAEIVHKAVKVLTDVGLLQRLDSGELFMTQMKEFIGSETDKAAIMRRARAKKKLLEGNNVTTPLPECYPTVTQSKSKEKDVRDIEVSNDTSCSEPSAKASEPKHQKGNGAEPEAPVEALPLNDGTDWRPTVSQYEEYMRLYPGVNIDQEFRNMRGWCLGNPSRRKTKAGIKRFVTNWLSKEQNKGTRRNSCSGDVRHMSTEEYMQATTGWWEE